MACNNIRYDLKCCGRIVLDRCQVHAQDETLSCTCPDPNAGFEVVVVNHCRHCQRLSLDVQHAVRIAQLTKEQKHLLNAEKMMLAKRTEVMTLKLSLAERASMMCKVAMTNANNHKLLKLVAGMIEEAAAEFRKKDADIDRDTPDVNAMDIIGTMIEDEWVMWCTGEQHNDALWKAGWNQE